jgi:uncharacterized protein YutE (UPF0331/DUF86 family)
MNFKPWLDKGEIQKVVVTQQALNDLLRLVERDLKDSQIRELSADRRFATAYGAALNICSYLIRKEGYRVAGQIGHHRTTLQLAAEIAGPSAEPYISMFEIARRKRNKIDYDIADTVSEREVAELIQAVIGFRTHLGI